MNGIDKYRNVKEAILTSFRTMPIEEREQLYPQLPRLLDFDRENPDLPSKFVDGILEAKKEDGELTNMDVFGELYEEPWVIKDVARYLSVTETTVRRYIKAGRLKASQPGRKYLIDYRELIKFKEQPQPV